MKARNLLMIALAAFVALAAVATPVVASFLYTDTRRATAMDRAHVERQQQIVMLRALCNATHAACPP